MIAQYTLDGRLVMVWDSVSDAARSLSLHKSGITRACKGETRQCGDFRWTYCGDSPQEDIGDMQESFLYGIVMVGLEMLGKWRTVREAGRALNIDSALISKVITGRRFHWQGVLFVWAESIDDARVKCINLATAKMMK